MKTAVNMFFFSLLLWSCTNGKKDQTPPPTAHHEGRQTANLHICTGTFTNDLIGKTVKRNIIRGCLADENKKLSMYLIEKKADGSINKVEAEHVVKSVQGETMIFTANSFISGFDRRYVIKVTPGEKIRDEGAMNDYFLGSIQISQKTESNYEPLATLDGLQFYTAFPTNELHWNYTTHGPEHWAEIKAEFEICKVGKHQSPINIREMDTILVPPLNINFSYKASGMSLINNGHALQVNVDKGNFLTIGGKKYELIQFHMHTPSEHLIEGNSYDLELHFVHQAEDKSLAVIGVLAQADDSVKKSPLLEKILREFPRKVNEPTVFSEHISPLELLPTDLKYYNYEGSLTTPPCSETVNWYVLQKITPINAEQVKLAKKILNGVNARHLPGGVQTMPLADRRIVKSP